MKKLLIGLLLIAGVNNVYANDRGELDEPRACDTYTTIDDFKDYYSHCGKQDLIRSNKAKPQIANRYRMVILTHDAKLSIDGIKPKKSYTFAWVDTKTDKVYSLPHMAMVSDDQKPRFVFKGKKACFSQKQNTYIFRGNLVREENMTTFDEEICMGLTKDGLRIVNRDNMYFDDNGSFIGYSDKDLL